MFACRPTIIITFFIDTYLTGLEIPVQICISCKSEQFIVYCFVEVGAGNCASSKKGRENTIFENGLIDRRHLHLDHMILHRNAVRICTFGFFPFVTRLFLHYLVFPFSTLFLSSCPASLSPVPGCHFAQVSSLIHQPLSMYSICFHLTDSPPLLFILMPHPFLLFLVLLSVILPSGVFCRLVFADMTAHYFSLFLK